MSPSTTPFFIVGCKRSGTTLVSHILNSHSRLAVYHESYFYPIFRPQLHLYGDLHRPANLHRLIGDMRIAVQQQGHELPAADEIHRRLVSPTFEGVVSTVLLLYAEAQGKMRGGDKTPEQHAFLPEILDRLPASPVVFMMRDPRDIAVSIQKVFGVSLQDAVHSWNTAFRSYQQVRDRVHLVRYRHLVNRPEEIVRSMAIAIGEAYEPAMLDFFQRVPESLSTRFGGEKLGRPIDASSVGNFRQLSDEAIREIEDACGAGMEALELDFAFPRRNRVSVSGPRPARSVMGRVIDGLRYYGVNRVRWQRGLVRWRLMLSLRLRYIALLGPLRRDW